MVFATVPSACCADWEVCSLIPLGLGRRHGVDPNAAGWCPPLSKAEDVVWLRGSRRVTAPQGDIVRFHDPPGVRGTGDGSGGVNPADGVVLYKPIPEGNAAATRKLTCIGATDDQAFCDVLLAHFMENW
jgi:hypothetical protein